MRGSLRPHQAHRLHRSREAQNSRYTLEVVDENMQAHLGADVDQRARQEVCVAHPVLERSKDMFNGSPAHCHRVGGLVESTLDGFQY